MKYVFQSGFAANIEKMLQFKEAPGHRRGSYEPGLCQFDRFCTEAYPEAVLLTKAIADDFSAGINGARRTPNCLKAVRELGKYLVSMGAGCLCHPGGIYEAAQAGRTISYHG